ncbi:ABC transporter substrate-binding protein [Pseudodesulfovibrio thermohalotolerans]|uniref:ABC transporter substrate-binding protein n=1 Tax=Pseudodesulfovibrio thermohalotolerans TaxID=2880651 RepID=UPI002440FCF3|nr:ABC transporter substrate-binding protein [Pseudodesulfovibrio thermohalotolerans]WFS60903.1 ABC transporter substrate-binding protein [Pseudodesulfovibrio thermohalotolerans]
MKRFVLIAACLVTCLLAQNAFAKTTITLEYPYAFMFSEVHNRIIEAFEAKNPDIHVEIRSTYDSYEDATQNVLRQAMTGNTPDITFQGLNRFRIFVDRGIAQPLGRFIKQEKDISAEGFHEGMINSGRFKNDIYALPFAISLPIAYYNMDLARKAGYTEETLPKTWDEVIAYAAKVDALGDEVDGMFFDYGITGNWLFQALVFSQGGAMLTPDEKKVAFDGPEGKWAMNTFRDMITKGKQPNSSRKASKTNFVTGKTGCYFTSTSTLAAFNKSIGGLFELKTVPFPSVKPGGTLPAGGNGVLMLTKDKEKQEAAWRVIKFWCGPEGAEIVARYTGYMPANQLAVKNLKEFYEKNPNNLTAVKSLPLMTGWYAFPGANGLKITDVIYEGMESLATGKTTDADGVLKDVAHKVQALLPR